MKSCETCRWFVAYPVAGPEPQRVGPIERTWWQHIAGCSTAHLRRHIDRDRTHFEWALRKAREARGQCHYTPITVEKHRTSFCRHHEANEG